MGKFKVNPTPLQVGSVVSVSFPFSNLKGQKIRPALILAHAEFDNLILCQITSKPYSSKTAIKIDKDAFIEGKLPIVSFIRPDKLFTADSTIIKSNVGYLTPKIKNLVLKNVRSLFV